MVPLRVVVCLAFLAVASATEVEQCGGNNIEGLSDKVELSPCKSPPCKLKKGTNQHITIKFTPETDLKEVKNEVKADVFGVPLPFIGVDGNSICNKIETEGGEKASCPLKAGVNYVYKDAFRVENFYPSIDVKVHWALESRVNNKNKQIICFEVPARIK